MSNYPAEYVATQSPFRFMTLRQAKQNGMLRDYLTWLISK